jgi:transposase
MSGKLDFRSDVVKLPQYSTARNAFPRSSHCRHLVLLIMAPNLALSQHDLVGDMILDGKLTTRKMAAAADCSERSIKAMRSNFRCFGSTKAPPNRRGRRQSMTPHMLQVLRERLLEKPGLYLEEMALFIWDEFDVWVSLSCISRALKSIKWSKKTARRVAKERNPDLRDFYLHNPVRLPLLPSRIR